MKPFKITKTILYILSGVLILIFNEQIMHKEIAGIIVGITVLAFALDILAESILEKKLLGENHFFFGGLIHMLIGIMLILVTKKIEQVCMVWAVWSIIRESKELSECVHRIYHKRPAFINLAESLIIIVMSFMMAMEPGEHHAHVHIIILGIELILEVLFPIANKFIDRFLDSRKAPSDDSKVQAEE